MPSRLPIWSNLERANTMLRRELADLGMLAAARLAASNCARSRTVTLSGFSIFERGERLHPFHWCVPRPLDEAEMVQAYEGYVDRELGRVPNPGQAARAAVGGSARPYFGRQRPASRWRVPLVRLVALAQHLDCEFSVKGQVVRAAGDGWLMEVSPWWAWSNTRSRRMTAKVAAVDVSNWELGLDSYRTAHPLATYLVGAGAPRELLWLANSLIRAEERGIFAIGLENLEPVRRRRARGRSTGFGANGAELECEEILQNHPADGLLQALYDAAVPGLMSSTRFVNTFPSPSHHQRGGVSEATRARWLEKIREASQGALSPGD